MSQFGTIPVRIFLTTSSREVSEGAYDTNTGALQIKKPIGISPGTELRLVGSRMKIELLGNIGDKFGPHSWRFHIGIQEEKVPLTTVQSEDSRVGGC